MKKLVSIECNSINISKCANKLVKELNQGNWVALMHPKDQKIIIPQKLIPQGPGIVVSSSGSTGGRHYCLHPYENLNQSAFSTGEWLKKQNIDPNRCYLFNPLPLNHVSGLMLWWRSKYWGASHKWINPDLMKNPSKLEKSFRFNYIEDKSTFLLSLVPTQLQRLIHDPAGIRWLKSFHVIWIGGSSLSNHLADIARKHKIQLAPCYGATETIAMVAALTPKEFIQGEKNLGNPLSDIELRLKENKVLEIRTSRLAASIWKNNQMNKLIDSDGWWASGDLAEIKNGRLKILGRIDNAIHSGGETVFPEQIEERLLNSAKKASIPIHSIFLIPIDDKEWGHRIIALVRLNQNFSEKLLLKIFNDLVDIVKTWLPAEKPCKWYLCQDLAPNSYGKWNLKEWTSWIKTKEPII